MALGVTDYIWSMADLLDRAEEPASVPPIFPPFTVIQGGVS